MENTQINNADFSPTKRFFVSMLTRDIELNDAILDLLDNCVDGALRINKSSKSPKPYDGFYAKLTIDENNFTIEDNCGGIPQSFRDYAFKMGRPHKEDEESEGTVGVYGIGMKRAIFKMGRKCTIYSNHPEGAFNIEITPQWIDDGTEWLIPMTETPFKSTSEKGTTISISDLQKIVAQKFSEKSYLSDLYNQIKHSMSFIIQKGFRIELNGKVVEHNPINIMTDESSIEPYIYKALIDEVSVDLVVGFYKNLEDDSEDVMVKRNSDDAGWTIICNDRVVLYCDKTHLTGWGFANVPRFHPQFNAISGVVRFSSKNPEKLPITTTKRGVDLSSTLYNDVRNKMMEGMLIFTRFTNQWKGEYLEEGKSLLKNASIHEAQSLFEKDQESAPMDKKDNWTNPNRNPNEWRYTPSLPTPRKKNTSAKIVFNREKTDINLIANYFFGHEDVSASEVGMKCFDTILSEVK